MTLAEVTVDRLAVMFDSVDIFGLQRSLDRDMAIESVTNYTAENAWRQGVRTAGGIFLQNKGYRDEKKLRTDLNPAHANAQTWREWSAIREHTRFARVTRVDVAIDYEADIRDYTFFYAGRSQQMFLDRSGDVESHYFGKSSSRQQLYAYDKGLEQEKSRGEWLRVEARQKPQGGEVLPSDLFSGIYAMEKVWNMEGLTFGQRAKLYLMHSDPAWSSYCTREERNRLLDMACDICGVLEPLPPVAYQEEKPRLLGEVEHWAGAEAVVSG